MKDYITVYLITRNRLFLLKRAIESVLLQREVDFELIVVDNASTDETKQYMKKISEEDVRITYIALDENMGACYARNLAINLSSGYYVTGMDDDDYFEPTRLIKLLAKYKANECAFVYGEDAFIENGKQFAQTNKPSVISVELMKYQNLVGNQVLSEKSKFVSVGGFDESLSAAQDYDMWLRMLLKFGNGVKSENVTQYVEAGTHPRISTSNNKFIGYMQFYRKHKLLFNRSQRKHQLLNIKYACRPKISLRSYLTLFDLHFLKRKLKILISRVLKSGDYGY